jgi:hypothetical protein
MESFFDSGFFGDAGQRFLNTPGYGTRAAFRSFEPEFRSFNQQQYFRSQYNQMTNDFLGVLGDQIRSGMDPTAQFSDYIGTQGTSPEPGGMSPFQSQYQELPPAFRGALQRGFNPPAQFGF